jgi:hypothetical protein
MEYHYIYYCVHPLGNNYFGVRSCKDITPQEDIKYLGSGVLWLKFLKENGRDGVKKFIVEIAESREEADLMESERMDFYKAKKGNMNIAPGGGGWQAKDTLRSDESKKKMSIAQKKRFEDPAEIEKNRQGQLKRFEDPKERERARIIAINQFKDPLARQKQRDAAIKQFEDPKNREKASIAAKKRYEDPAEIEKNRQRQLKRFEDPKNREKASIAAKKRYEDPAEIEKNRQAQSKKWADPMIRQRRWVNNGEISKRIHPDMIPEGFVLGRLKKQSKG